MEIGAAMRRAQPAHFFFFLRIYKARHSVVYRGVWEYAPPGNLDHMRVLLRPSETTTTTQNLWQLDCNSGIFIIWPFLGAPSFGIGETGTELSLGSCRFESFMLAGHEAVIHIEICAVSE